LPLNVERPHHESWWRTRLEAEAWLARELARAPDAFDPSQSLGDYLRYWFRLHAPSWAPQTRRRYHYEIAACRPIWSYPLEKLRADHILRVVADIQARGCTARYAYHVGSLLRRALDDAVRWKILTESPADHVALPTPEPLTTKAWDVDEIRAVLAAIVGHRFEAIYLLILWGGLRIGEAIARRWDEIGDDGTVRFDQAEHSNIQGRPIGATKRRREREVELPAIVVSRLKALRAAGPAPLARPARTTRDVAFVYVAQRPDGKRWTARAVRDDWNRLVGTVTVDDERAVPPFRPHGGRRSYGTLQMVAGTPLADLSMLMGHSSPAVTAQRYLATSKARRRAAAERLAALLLPTEREGEGQAEGQATI